MKTQDQAFNRLLKKLSALRATLKSEERDLLDGLVISPSDEVMAHSMSVTPISPAKAPSPDEVKAASLKINQAKAPAKAPSADEAKAQALHLRTAKAPAKAPSANEAKAQALHLRTAKTPAKAPSADEVKANAMTVRIVYDQTKDEYQRIP